MCIRDSNYLRRQQTSDGSWCDPWPCCRVRTTASVVLGLRAAGIPAKSPLIERAIGWLVNQQQASGAWSSSMDDTIATADALPGKSGGDSPMRTALAVLALVSAGQTQNACVYNGVEYLLRQQNVDGSWATEEFSPAEVIVTLGRASDYNVACSIQLALSSWCESQHIS